MKVMINLPNDLLKRVLESPQYSSESFDDALQKLLEIALAEKNDFPSIPFYAAKSLAEKLEIAINSVKEMSPGTRFKSTAVLPEQAWRVTTDGEKRLLGKQIKERILNEGLAEIVDEGKLPTTYVRSNS